MRVLILAANVLLLVGHLVTHALAAPEGVSAGLTATALADPLRWRFVGCDAFPSNELRDALTANVEVIVASRSAVTIDSLIETVTRQLTLGYRAAGYFEATVSAEVDRDTRQLVMMIIEGRLFRQGRVEVRGATSIDTARLMAAVTKKQAPAEAIPVFSEVPAEGDAPLSWLSASGAPEKLTDAIWNPGQPAAFHSTSWTGWNPVLELMGKRAVPALKVTGSPALWESQIQLILKRMGYLDATLTAAIELEDDSTATLVITIRDEGPRMVLGEIEVVGNTRNTTADIIDYLQLQPGMPFDAMRHARLHWQLKQANRFLKHDVEVISPPFGDGPSRLKLTLVEAPGIPTLKESFTPEQQVVIRAANWMSSQREFDSEVTIRSKNLAQMFSKQDAVETTRIVSIGFAKNFTQMFSKQFAREFFSDRDASFRLILSPVARSAMLELGVSDRDNRLVWGQVLSVGRDSNWLLAPHRQSQLEWGGLYGSVTLKLEIVVHPPDSEGRMSSTKFGLGQNSRTAKDGEPIRNEILQVSPLALLLKLTKETSEVELTDDLMTIRGDSNDLVIDVKSERIVTWQFDFGGSEATVRWDRNVYADATRKWQSQRDAAKNEHHASAPVTATLNYLTEEARAVESLQSQRLPTWFRLAERVVQSGVLRPVDEAVAKSNWNETAPRSFSIPVEPNPKSPLGALAWLDPCLRAALPYYAKVFPHDTPGWTIGREVTLMMLRPKGVEIPSPYGFRSMLEEDQAGPLHFLLAAQLFGIVSPGHKFVLAQRGLKELTPPALRRDVVALLDQRSVSAQIANGLAELLRSLDESDMEDLAELLDLEPSDRTVVASLLQELARRRDEPANSLFPELVERAWPIIEPRLEAALRDLAVPPAQPPVKVTRKLE